MPSRARIPGPSPPFEPAVPTCGSRLSSRLFSPQNLGWWAEPSHEGGGASSNLAGTRGACPAGTLWGVAWLTNPRAGAKLLNPSFRGRGLLGCAGPWPMGVVKGVALGGVGALLGSFPSSPARPDPRSPEALELPGWRLWVPLGTPPHFTRDPRRPRALCPPGGAEDPRAPPSR